MIRSAKQEDLNQIAALHIESIEGHFLPKLGLDLLAKYYKEFLSSENIFLVCINEKNKINGFSLGTPSSEIGRNNFIKKNWPKLSLRILLLCMRFDKDTLERIRKYLPSLLIKNKDTESIQNDLINKEMSWLSLSVSEECKGRGIAQLLGEEFEKILRERGYTGYTFTVHKTNGRTIRFHEKQGRSFYKETESELFFRKSIIDI